MTNGKGTMRAWRTHEYGQPLEALKLDTVDIPEPEAGEVRVKVQGIPLNLADMERVTGGNMFIRPELPYSPGMEVMGVVDSCGEGAEKWQGERVVAITKGAHGGYAEYCICPTASLFIMPDTIPLPGAAALYFPFHLAWLGLYERAKVQAGETVLVNGAAGGVGAAAVQLAVAAGARVIAVAGSDEKLAYCKQLGAEITVNHNTEDFVAVVREATNHKGVDIIFDNIGEEVLEQCLASVAYDGRYVVMGFSSDKSVADEKFYVPRRLAMANVSLCCIMLYYAEEPMLTAMKDGAGLNFVPTKIGRELHAKLVEMVEQGALVPVVGEVINFEDVPQGLDDLLHRKTLGRTIVKLFD
ncbi:2-haloacrylate reductase [Halioglobus japonicus]|nr:2-haloacrylate reductase [Halioglobus japonicus]